MIVDSAGQLFAPGAHEVVVWIFVLYSVDVVKLADCWRTIDADEEVGDGLEWESVVGDEV